MIFMVLERPLEEEIKIDLRELKAKLLEDTECLKGRLIGHLVSLHSLYADQKRLNNNL